VSTDLDRITVWPDWHVGDVFGIRAETSDLWVAVELFERRVEDRRFVFKNPADGKLILPPMSLDAALRLYESGRMRKLPKSALGDHDVHDVPPETADRFWRLRLAITRAFDEDQRLSSASRPPNYAKSARKLRLLVADVLSQRPDLRQLGWTPSVGAVRRWLQHRGTPGDRRAADMLDCSGQGERKKKNTRRRKLLNAIARWYWSLDTRRPDDAYARVGAMFARLNKRRASKDRTKALLKCPCKEAIRKAINALECFETVKEKWGERRAVELYGSVGEGLVATRYLEKIVFDHTKSDTWVVFDPLRGWIRGRAWVTLAIDVFTRLILAWFITYRRPSTHTAATLLKRVIRPKSWVRDRYPDLAGEVNIFGKPAEVIVDHEWAHEGPSFIDACRDAKISVTWPRRRNPQAKAIGEAIFDTVNELVFHREAGAVSLPPNEMRALGYNPSKDKLIAVDVLEAHLVHAIYDIYHRDIHSGIGMAPLRAYQLECAKNAIPTHDDLEILEDAFGVVVKNLVLSKEGVTHDGIRYHDQDLVAELLCDLAPDVPRRGRRKHGSVTVPIPKGKLDPENIDIIKIWNWKRNRYVRLPAAGEHREYARDLPQDVHHQIRAFAKQHGFDFDDEGDRLQARDRFRELIENAVPERLNEARIKQLRLLHVLSDRKPVLDGDEVRVVHVPSTPDGRPVRIPVAADCGRADGGAPPKVLRRGGQRATRKAAATRARKRAEEAISDREAALSDAIARPPEDRPRSGPAFLPPQQRSAAESPERFLDDLRLRRGVTGSVSSKASEEDPEQFLENLGRAPSNGRQIG
jgi:putative transposase